MVTDGGGEMVRRSDRASEVEAMERSASGSISRLRSSYSEKDKDAACANVTIRRLEGKNESLQKKLRERMEEDEKYRPKMAALRRIVVEGKREALAVEIERSKSGGSKGRRKSSSVSLAALEVTVHNLLHWVDTLLQSEALQIPNLDNRQR